MRRILRAWHSLPRRDVLEGRSWYYLWHDNLFRLADSRWPPPMVVGVFAALSPMVTLDQCWRDTKQVLEGGVLHGLRARTNAARAIYDGGDPLVVLKAPKVRDFYLCLIDPAREEHAVVVDRHMHRIYREGLKKKGPKSVTRREYRLAAQLFRRTAYEVGVQPHQLQAAFWVNRRRKTNENS